jgi:hypothetical protein
MMMPPTPDLAEHLRNLRTLAEARAAYRADRERREDLRRHNFGKARG